MLKVMRVYRRDIRRDIVLARRIGQRMLVRVRRLTWADVQRSLRRIDVRKPLHAVMIGAILAGIVAPVADVLVTNERYHMADQFKAVAETPSPMLMSKLEYDKDKQATVFNAEGAKSAANTKAPDALTASIGAGGKKDKQLYTATLPDNAAQGIVVQDNVNNVAITFKPQVALMSGRSKDGHVVYPLNDQAGQMIFTPKANGLKEDIVLASAPKNNVEEFHYHLDFPSSVSAQLNPDGSIGFYTANPELFGNISYGSDADMAAVEKARDNATKQYLMFSIPAPTVRETGKRSQVTARFALSGKDLTVRTSGLAKANYPLSIDPTFLLTSTADFVLGSIDDNIDLSVAGQVGRQALVGGSTPGWTPNSAPSLAYAQFASSLVAYNGFLYMMGGGSGATGCTGTPPGTITGCTSGTSTNDVRYISLDPNTGALGTGTPAQWTPTSKLITARQGLVSFGFNGYLYSVGGEDDTGTPITAANSVEYAKINSDGSVGTWATTGHLVSARSYPAGAIYQGLLYVMGGTTAVNNATPISTVEYARINGDGTIPASGTGAWTQSSSLATGNLVDAAGTTALARSKFRAGAYNGYLYVAGGQTNTTTVNNLVQYAPIQSDGSIGAWVNTTAFPTARRDHGMTINNGYIYVFGGCTGAAQACAGFLGDTQYAVINADGTVGQWQSTVPYNTGGFNSRMPAGVTAYSNHLYFVGGCSAETATNNCATQLVGTFITNIDTVGRYDRGIQTIQTTPPFNNNATTVARTGAQAVALNGYLYLIGGCSVASCNTAASYSSVVEYAQLNANGSLGAFTANANPLIDNSAGANTAGRIGMSVVAYNDKIYVIGGVQRTTPGNVDAFRLDILQSTQNASTGALGTFTAATNSLPVAKAFGTAVVWHNWIFVLGGLSAAATVVGTIYHSQITSDNPGAWSATTTGLTNARWGHSGGIWGNWIYVVGGQSTTTGTYITAANGTEQLTITNAGDITAAASVQNVAGAPLTRLMGGFVHNGILYTFGGYTSGSTAAVATINWALLDKSTGALAAWSATNIGNNAATYGLSTARGGTTAVASGGNFYVLGGCTATMATTTFSSCATFVTTANATEVNLPNNGGTGQTNTFTTGSSNLVDLPTVGGTAGRADQAAVAYNGKIYVIGGCRVYTAGACTTELGDIERADIAVGGNVTGSWTAQTSLPGGEVRSQMKAVAYNGFLYVIGGQSAGANATANVWYTTIDNTGTLGATWSNVTNALGNDLPVNRRDFGMAIMGGYVYVVGGEDATPTKQTTVYYAAVNNDGTLGSWATTTAFTTARNGGSFVAYNGSLYIIGGYDGTTTLSDIQYGVIASDGTIPAWNYVTDVPRSMRGRQAIGTNGYMYFVGDEAASTDVSYVDINANGTLGTLQRSSTILNGSHAHGSAVTYNGVLYDMGGCVLASNVCSTVTAAGDKGGQLAISRVGHYSKLFNTQVDTSPTQLIINGANNGPGAAVEFKLQTASSTDPVLGVAQLIRPVIFNNFYTVQALNSSGANVGVALNYLFLITLDDNRSGTFPDVPNTATGYAQTAVTDITLNYHANPGRRLRHGASFTDTGCNPTPANGCLLDTAP